MLEFEFAFIESTRYRRRSRKEGECLVRKSDILLISGLEYADFFSASSYYLTLTWKMPAQSKNACISFSWGSAASETNGSLMEGVKWE